MTTLFSLDPARRAAASPREGSLAAARALLAVNGVLFAGVYAFAKVAGEGGVSPLGVLTWQVLFAAIVVGVVAAARGELPALARANVRYAALAGLLGITGPNLVSFAALAHLPAGLVGLITALSPVFTYAIAVALRAEALHPWRAAGIALGFAGVLTLVLSRGWLPGSPPLLWTLAALLAPVFLAGGNVFRTLAWPEGLKPLAAATLLLALQSALLIPLSVVLNQFEAPGAGLQAQDGALFGAGVLTALFYLGAFQLQRLGGPVVVGQLGYVITLASLAIGALAFGERYGPSTLIAVVVVLAGLMLVNRRQQTAEGANLD